MNRFKALNVDYFSNISPASYPDGLDTEVFSFETLEQANNNAFSTYDREHVTTFIRNSDLFSKDVLQNEIDYSNLRWSVDESEDLEVITKVFNHFAPDIFFGWEDVLELVALKPDIFIHNQTIKNNEGQKWVQDKNFIKGQKKLSQVATCFYQKDLKCFCLINGHLISVKQKDVKSLGFRWQSVY